MSLDEIDAETFLVLFRDWEYVDGIYCCKGIQLTGLYGPNGKICVAESKIDTTSFNSEHSWHSGPCIYPLFVFRYTNCQLKTKNEHYIRFSFFYLS